MVGIGSEPGWFAAALCLEFCDASHPQERAVIWGISLGDIWENFKSSPPWYLASMGFLLGGVLASFLGVVLYRTPQGIGLAGRSACICGRQLKVYENVPVLAWIVLQGRTRCCKQRIPAYMFVCEALGSTALMFAGFYGIIPLGAALALFVLCIVAIRVWLVIVFKKKQKTNVPHV